MKRFLTLAGSLALFGLITACQTPGYDYAGRAAPNFPEALNYTDVVVGRFDGPAGNLAQREFEELIRATELEGRPWFVVLDPDRPQGIYEGRVDVVDHRAEITRVRERGCIEYAGPFNCKREGIVEQRCVKDIVEVAVQASLTDQATGRQVFASSRGGVTETETCFDVAEYPDTDQTLGQYGPVEYETYRPQMAPFEMIAEAVIEAVAQFRTDIAPYAATFRAEIVTKPLVGEEVGDARFAAAVKATKQGNFMGACAQWQELAAAYPAAPGIQHNWGACLEARGNLAEAHSQYARAAELARGIPLLKDKDAKPIFNALERINRGRYEGNLIEQAKDPGGS
jgi:hypothetical protein